MERSEAGSAGATANLSQFEAALEHIAQSIEGSAKKTEASLSRITGALETKLGRLETKLDITGETLAALADQFKETGNFLGRFVEEIGKWLDSDTIQKAGKAISLVPGNAADEKVVSELFSQSPGQLRDRFRSREGRVAALESGGDEVVAKDTIAKIRHEQELILAALLKQANVFRSKIDDLLGIASNPGMSETSPAIRDSQRSLKAVRDVLDKIRKFATDPALREFIDRSQPALDRKPRQTGALATSPGALQFARLGADDADATGRSMQRLDESLGEAAQGYNLLNDEVERYKDSIGTLATGLAETNTQLGGQADWLTIVGGLLPGVGQQITDLFDSGVEGAAELDRAVAAMGERFLDAFEGAIVRGESLGDTLKGLGRDLANLALNEVKTGGLDGLFDILGGLFSPNAKGNAFTNGRLTALAKGGAFTNTVVNRPTLFPMADGMGLMGEAGPEAVLPLTRLANGDLGVSMPGGAAPAAAGPTIIYQIDARGADREGMRAVVAELRRIGAKADYTERTLERRAVGAVAYARGRGGNIARAFGGW